MTTIAEPDDPTGRRAQWRAQHGRNRDTSVFDKFWTGKQPAEPTPDGDEDPYLRGKDLPGPDTSRGNHVPGEGKNPGAGQSEDLRQFARDLFKPPGTTGSAA